MTGKLAWHWTAQNAEGRPILKDGRLVPAVGVKLTYPGKVKMCGKGLHASAKSVDALTYAPGCWLHRVRCEEIEEEGKDKIVCRQRTVLASASLMWELVGWAEWCSSDAASYARAAASDASAAATSYTAACAASAAACYARAAASYASDAASYARATRYAASDAASYASNAASSAASYARATRYAASDAASYASNAASSAASDAANAEHLWQEDMLRLVFATVVGYDFLQEEK